jgi:hypothetical protein
MMHERGLDVDGEAAAIIRGLQTDERRSGLMNSTLEGLRLSTYAGRRPHPLRPLIVHEGARRQSLSLGGCCYSLGAFAHFATVRWVAC